MKILIVTDAWAPVVSGVVRTYEMTVEHLRRMGHRVEVIAPHQFTTIRCPTDSHLRLALAPGRKVTRLIEAFQPDAIHLATEGPLGTAARHWCVKRGLPFTSSYETKMPEHLWARAAVPPSLTYAMLRWFHNASSAVMVSTATLRRELQAKGFHNLQHWSRGVDVEVFRPRDKNFLRDPRPISMCVGRVAVEKNIKAFLSLNLPGTKYVVGDGPQLAELRREFPEVRFAGSKQGEELARYYAAADVMVFPSLTDTFGLVLLEAMAAGVPVAAYPVAGPLDVVGNSGAGCLDADLARAVRGALKIEPAVCRRYAERFRWDAVTRQFLNNLHPLRPWHAAAA